MRAPVFHEHGGIDKLEIEELPGILRKRPYEHTAWHLEADSSHRIDNRHRRRFCDCYGNGMGAETVPCR
jgi:hypothetical protein